MEGSLYEVKDITIKNYVLTDSLPIHPFATTWKHQKTICFQGTEKGALGTNKFMEKNLEDKIHIFSTYERSRKL